MKKIFTLVATALLIASTVQAQRINNLKIEDGGSLVVPLSKFAAFTPGATVDKAGKLEMVFLPGQDLSNLTVTPTFSANTTLTDPATMPTDYTQDQNVTITSTTAGNAVYTLIFKNIKPIALPMEELIFTEEWTKDTEGWASSCIEFDASGNAKFGSASRSMIFAFKDAPEKLTYSINVAAETWTADNVFDVEASADGVTWTQIVQYNNANPMPGSKAIPADKKQEKMLTADTRYVRFLYTTRKASNVTLTKVSVTKAVALENVGTSDTDLVLAGIWSDSEFAKLDNSNVTSVDLTAVTGLTAKPVTANPNCLIYVSSELALAASNIVKVDESGNATAEAIVLTDGAAFNNTMEFLAKNISYDRTYTTTGWSSFCLPFPVSSFPNGVAVETFIEAEGDVVRFSPVSSTLAYTPYIANITGEFEKQFTATDVTVSVTSPEDVKWGNYTLKGTFAAMNGEGLYLLKTNGAGFGKGTVDADIPAFRAYIQYTGTEPTDAKQLALGHGEGGTTGFEVHGTEDQLKVWSANGALIIVSGKPQTVKLYGVDGCLARDIELTTGNNTINGLAKGLYLLNNQKVIIK